MDLMHNQVIRVSSPVYEGIFRVILDEPAMGKTVLVRLDPPSNGKAKHPGGRKRLQKPKKPRKQSRPPNLCSLIWADRDVLVSAEQDGCLQQLAFEPRNHRKPTNATERSIQIRHKRELAIAPFLNFDFLRERIVTDGNISGLIRLAIEASELSRSVIYKLFSTLCRGGFTARCAELDYDLCGAPGKARPCAPEGRKKSGRKTTKERIALASGIILPPEQPGTSEAWINLILAADQKIPTPKPPMPQRVTQIIQSHFVTRYVQEPDGKITPKLPELGEYPNSRQIRRVLEREIPKLEQVLARTTSGHFDRTKRGLVGKAWQGVSGPGHTWAIDSTVGDIYLRSSINRAWIIGRPIVYIIVDVWSTAIVGFYVCLMGPSWDMAKLALFSAASNPELIGSLLGFQPILSLQPFPTLCAKLLCDHGEYLSVAARISGMDLELDESYTAPYRPDLKGLVEVLHRIAKDQQFHFVPGAIDARRAEYELRRFNPNEAVLTIREFTHYLYVIFTKYNLSADRTHRLDAHMRADGVMNTPTGLWNWGHKVGIGTRKAVSFSDLCKLLPHSNAAIRRDGVRFAGRHYESSEATNMEWTALARNFGSWEIPCNYFPGSVSRIWTPRPGGTGQMELSLSDQSTASAELTTDEVADAEAYYLINRAQRVHLQTMDAVSALINVKNIIQKAARLTKEAIANASGPTPNLTEARQMERELIDTPKQPQTPTSSEQANDNSLYLETMSALLSSMNFHKE